MSVKNVFYAQSGGVTSVINATACGVIQTSRSYPESIGKVYAGKNGILGALNEELIDTSLESDASIQALFHTPSGAFGSCRYKLADMNKNKKEYFRLIEVFKAHDIGYFFYNGGGDSQDTAHKISCMSKDLGYPLICIGIPKTIDNDLLFMDSCPGFGSVAKYIAISTLEAGLDISSMAASSTKIFILEVMGRHTGWIAAASGLVAKQASLPPHIILFPEIDFSPELFCEKVNEHVTQHGYCVIVASEGIKTVDGQLFSANEHRDAFGHKQLGGLAPKLAQLIYDRMGYKYHWAVSDYLQRAARHIASRTDVEQAYALGQAAVKFALSGKVDIMPTIVRDNDEPYQWHIGQVALSEVANIERTLPKSFITKDGFHITEKCKKYLKPLIQGEAYPPYQEGIPQYIRLKNTLIAKKLPAFKKQ